MKKLIQTRLHKGMNNPKDRGNCFPTVIACFMDLNSPEDCIQIQEHYNNEDGSKNDNWIIVLLNWLDDKGWELGSLRGHQADGSYYLVTGKSPRGVNHICIYRDGKLYHDPHPEGTGLVSEDYFEYLTRI